jgi:hypothetical protein
MRAARLSRNKRQWIISAVLLALVTRALIPAGFMPAMDRPLSFQICPDGFPAQVLASSADPHAHHHHHPEAGADHGASSNDASGMHQSHSAAGKEHCVFAAAMAAGPLAFTPTIAADAVIALPPADRILIAHAESLRFRIPQPRGPPALS